MIKVLLTGTVDAARRAKLTALGMMFGRRAANSGSKTLTAYTMDAATFLIRKIVGTDVIQVTITARKVAGQEWGWMTGGDGKRLIVPNEVNYLYPLARFDPVGVIYPETGVAYGHLVFYPEGVTLSPLTDRVKQAVFVSVHGDSTSNFIVFSPDGTKVREYTLSLILTFGGGYIFYRGSTGELIRGPTYIDSSGPRISWYEFETIVDSSQDGAGGDDAGPTNSHTISQSTLVMYDESSSNIGSMVVNKTEQRLYAPFASSLTTTWGYNALTDIVLFPDGSIVQHNIEFWEELSTSTGLSTSTHDDQALILQYMYVGPDDVRLGAIVRIPYYPYARTVITTTNGVTTTTTTPHAAPEVEIITFTDTVSLFGGATIGICAVRFVSMYEGVVPLNAIYLVTGARDEPLVKVEIEEDSDSPLMQAAEKFSTDGDILQFLSVAGATRIDPAANRTQAQTTGGVGVLVSSGNGLERVGEEGGQPFISFIDPNPNDD